MLTRKLPAERRKPAMYSALKSTVHHEVKTRNLRRSRKELLGYELLLWGCQRGGGEWVERGVERVRVIDHRDGDEHNTGDCDAECTERVLGED
jgi:hypothetical protein